MPDQTQTQFDETKLKKHALAASKRLYERCLDLAKNNYGFEIIFNGKGDGPITMSCKTFEGPVM